ncbi:group II decarboxylase [Aspergillus affinis]|uniref:group II decarboxylase n=1 Tax=Aspergillus affinis TaxID=1070780 RepID=UPI0022FE3718|nr:group II decarboxylase [Aspergillus affinis]KAI9045498.1 group II decarboxylase [Aspergillus affinis]
MFLTESIFTESAYGECLEKYKERLGLGSDAAGDLVSLINVTMSPWPPDSTALSDMVKGFKKIAGEEVQLVLEAEIPDHMMSKYKEKKNAKPDQFFTIANVNKEHLMDLVETGSFRARMDEGIPKPQPPSGNPQGEPVMPNPLAAGFQVKIKRVVVLETLWFDSLSSTYPEKMQFYLYGSGPGFQMDHVLKKALNAQLCANCVQVATHLNNSPLSAHQGLVRKGILIEFDRVPEHAMQPLSTNDGHDIANAPGLGFVPGARSEFTAFRDRTKNRVLTKGTLELKANLFADWYELNMDPADHH